MNYVQQACIICGFKHFGCTYSLENNCYHSHASRYSSFAALAE